MKKQNTIYLGIGIVAIILIAAIMMFSAPKGDLNEESFTIALTAPLSGDFAFYGNEVQNALKLSYSDYKKNGGKLNVDLISDDNTGVSAQVVTSYNNLKLKQNFSVIISTNSPLSATIKPIAEQDKKVLLALVTGAKDFADGYEYVFRDAITSDSQGYFIADELIKESKLNVATLVVNDDYGLSASETLKERILANNGTIVAEEVFGNSDTDIRAQLTKIKNSNPDAIFFVGRENSLILGVKQMTELGIDLSKVYSINSFDSENVLEGTKGISSGLKYASVDIKEEDQNVISFRQEYSELYGTQPSIYAFDAYASMQYLLQSAEKCGPTSEEIKTCLETETFNTIRGYESFTEDHDMRIPTKLFEVQ